MLYNDLQSHVIITSWTLQYIKSWYIMTDLSYIKIWLVYIISYNHIIVYHYPMTWYNVITSHLESIIWHDCGKSFIKWIRVRRTFQNSWSLPRIYLKTPEFGSASKNLLRIPIKNQKTSISHNLVSRKQKPVSEKQIPRGRQGNQPDLPG